MSTPFTRDQLDQAREWLAKSVASNQGVALTTGELKVLLAVVDAVRGLEPSSETEKDQGRREALGKAARHVGFGHWRTAVNWGEQRVFARLGLSWLEGEAQHE